MSNSVGFLEVLEPKEEFAGAQDFSAGVGETVLGLLWRPDKDVLDFRVASVNGTEYVIYTRLGIVSKLASIFDPLRLAAPFTVNRKIRFRD